MIVNISRRTDIPAFYSEWLMNRIRAGFALTRNPFNAKQISRVSLQPEDTELLIFWTRNPDKLMPHLGELNSQGHRYFFQYTLTGYPRSIEGAVPRPHRAIESFKALSQLIGANKVIWRYDPILLSNQVDLAEHKRLFAKIASLLAGHTEQVIISFADFYRKTERNLAAVDNLICSDITFQTEQLMVLSEFMAKTAAQAGMEIRTCGETLDLNHLNISDSKCIDEHYIKQLFDLDFDGKKDTGQREECGCIKSTDIGIYNSCLHQCSYCYATHNHQTAVANYQKHEAGSPFLIGGCEGVPDKLLQPNYAQTRLI